MTPSGVGFRVLGSGPPLLWLPGFLVPVSALDPYISEFAHHFTCVVFDLRGSGETPPSCLPHTTARMAMDALDVLTAAGYDAAHVQGVSLGGMVAQELAIRAPERVLTLVLGATTAGGGAATPSSVGALWSVLGSPPGGVRPGRLSLRGAFNQAWAASRHDATARLTRVAVPTLVVHGEQDTLLPPVNAVDLAALVPGAELRLLDGAGHFFAVEEPEAAAEVVLEWLRAPHPPSRGAPQVTDGWSAAVVGAPLRLLRRELLPWRHAYRSLRAR